MADFAVNIILKARDDNAISTIRAVTAEYKRALGQMGKMGARTSGRGNSVALPGGMPGMLEPPVGGRGRGRGGGAFGGVDFALHRYAGALGGAAANTHRFTEANKAMLRAPLEAAMEFEHQMKRVKAMTDDASISGNFTRLNEEARKLGRDTEFSALDAAHGMEMLGAAGFTTNQQIAAMSPLLDAASASGTDLAGMSEIMTDTMASFGLKTNDSARMMTNATMAMDSMVSTTLLTSTSMHQLFEGIRKVGPIANTLGIDIHEVNAMLGTLAESGIKGAEGGTALRNMMLSVAGKPTADMRKMLKHMGIGTKQLRAELGANGIEGAMRLLMTRMQKLSPELQVFASNILFERRTAAPALTILQKLDSSYADLKTKIEGSGGASKRAADEMRTSSKMGVEQLMGSINDLAMTIGDDLWPILKPLMKDAEGAVETFSKWAKENPLLIQTLAKASMTIVGLGTVMSPVLLGASSMLSIVGHLNDGFGLLGRRAGASTRGLGMAGGAMGSLGLAGGTAALLVAGLAAELAIVTHYADELGNKRFKLEYGEEFFTKTEDVAMAREQASHLDKGIARKEKQLAKEKAALARSAEGNEINHMMRAPLLEQAIAATEADLEQDRAARKRLQEQFLDPADERARADRAQNQMTWVPGPGGVGGALVEVGPNQGPTMTGRGRRTKYGIMETPNAIGMPEVAAALGGDGSQREQLELLRKMLTQLERNGNVQVNVDDKKTVSVERGGNAGVIG